MDGSINMRKFYELIDLYKYGAINGEKTELIIKPLYEDGKYDNNKRVITIGFQGGLSRDRDNFVVDLVDFDTKIMPYLINYFEGDEKLEFSMISRSTMDNVTSKAVYETQTGDLFYLETLNNSLFDVVESRRKITSEIINRKEKTKDEKDLEEILQYARKRRTTSVFYKEKFNNEETKEIELMISTLVKEKKVNISNSNNSRINNEMFIEEYVKQSNLEEELKEKIIWEKSKIAIMLGAEARIINKIDLTDEKMKSRVDFIANDLANTDYFDLRKNSKFSTLSETKKINSRNKQSEIMRLKERIETSNSNDKEKEDRINFCNEVLNFIESTNNKKTMEDFNKVLDSNLENYNNIVMDDYFELNNAIDLVVGGKLNHENYELIIDKKDNTRTVRLTLLNGLSRGDEFDFLFTNGIEFDEKIQNILDKLLKNKEAGETKLFRFGIDENTLNPLESFNQIILKGYDKEFYKDKKEKKTIIKKEINPTSFDKLHKYVNKYQIRTNSQNQIEIFEIEGLIPYDARSERERLDIEFATFWNVMAGIYDSPRDKMVGEVYAFGKEREVLFQVMNDYFTKIIVNNQEFNLNELKKLFADSRVDKWSVIFNRLFQNEHYVNYVLRYYQSITEEKKYTIEETIDDNKDKIISNEKKDTLNNFENAILNRASSLEKEELQSLREQIINALKNLELKNKDEDSLKKDTINDKQKINLMNLEKALLNKANNLYDEEIKKKGL